MPHLLTLADISMKIKVIGLTCEDWSPTSIQQGDEIVAIHQEGPKIKLSILRGGKSLLFNINVQPMGGKHNTLEQAMELKPLTEITVFNHDGGASNILTNEKLSGLFHHQIQGKATGDFHVAKYVVTEIFDFEPVQK